MGYPRDIDEIDEGALRSELRRREEDRASGRCDYCHKERTEPACRFPERHQAEMVLPVRLEILVRGVLKSGKTTAALAIQRQLEKLGARVCVEDGEGYSAHAVSVRQAKINNEEPLLKGRMVIIKTEQPPA